MKQLNLFLELTRLKRPIGYMLLFWPCLWGLTIAYDFSISIQFFMKYALLFFLGAVLMRSAGCVVNDIIDKKFDSKVERTKNRPIASGDISIKLGLFYVLILCGIAFIVLIQFNFFTIILALGSMPLAFAYPLMKRFTYWPQLFLGVTFNYGLILGWTSINSEISIVTIIFYIGAIFWTLGYDTIYGFQDIKDDEIIGVKSTSIKFKKNPKFFILLCYLVFFVILTYLGIVMNFNTIYFGGLILIAMHLFIFQIKNLNTNLSSNCLKIFKSNNFLGLLIFLNLLIGKIITQ
ncbi:MAG: 4-hydroxybenzoate octaprenyltransferase [Candidatus Pelagibacter sp.]